MFHYHKIHWLFFFYFYSFCGWCFESAYVSIRQKKLVNRGFIRGPFLPLYGSGAMMMLAVSMPFRENIVLTYFAGCVGATALEYVTGLLMELLFNIRYWDYSNQKFNLQGRICLSSTIAWGFLTILMTQVVHKPIEQFVMSIPGNVLAYVTSFLTLYIVADFALSFQAAMDLRFILMKMQRVKEEMERLQKRLDVIIAFSNEEKEPKKQVRDEIAELRARYNLYMEGRRQYKEMLGFYKRDMIRNNPGMLSTKFKDTFEELKNLVMDKMNKE